MANQSIEQLNTLTASTIATADQFVVRDASADETKSITLAEFNKATGDVLDSTFGIIDNTDNTKRVRFQVSSIATGTTRTVTVPNADTDMVGTTTTQILTNKTIDPSQNTIDGDKLDITFAPTNYTPTITGVAEADDVDDLSAHLKGIDNALTALITEERFIYPVYSNVSVSSSQPNNYPVGAAAGYADFTFSVPVNTATFDVDVIVFPDTTETIQYDVATQYGAVGEQSNNHTGSISNGTQAVTLGQYAALSMDSALGSMSGGDIVSLRFESDTDIIRVMGLRLRFTKSQA